LRWSSAAAYDGSVQAPTWLKAHFVLDCFSPGDSRANYREFMEAGVDTRTAEFYTDLGW